MNFWSVIAAVVVILKLIGTITLGWGAVVGIAVLLLFAPWIIAGAIMLFGLLCAGVVLLGAWILDKIFGKKRRAKPAKLFNELRRSAQQEHRDNRRKYR